MPKVTTEYFGNRASTESHQQYHPDPTVLVSGSHVSSLYSPCYVNTQHGYLLDVTIAPAVYPLLSGHYSLFTAGVRSGPPAKT